MKITRLETIAAMRSSADEYQRRAQVAKQAGEGAWAEDGETFAHIASELREIASYKAHERAYATTRWITNANSGIRPADARAIAAVIEVTPAVEEISVEDMLPGDKGVMYRVRLVYYYDPTTQTNRWATEYTNDKERPAISDNEQKEDAEYRYEEFKNYMGQAKG